MGQLAAIDILNTIVEFLKDMGRKFGVMNYFFLFVGVMLAAIIVSIILVRFSYEIKSLKTVDSLNAYFKKKPLIGEDNLIEFNNKIKSAPQAMRIGWQQYMLNREDSPSKYINIDTCVEKPLRTSSIDKNLKNMGTVSAFLIGLSFVFVLFAYVGTDSLPVVFGIASLIPIALGFVYTVFALIFRSWKNAVQADLYQNFHNFQRNLTKAVVTLPTFVDYEILFTKQDIKKNIPILNEYIEKRAIIEQEELEKARLESSDTEKYDFSSLGINGSLVLDRAMRESEIYLKAKRRLEAECDQIETEKENYRKNFDIATKEYQRRLQASRENLDRLKSQQEASTNRIESNYIRKQQADEMKKQEQLEKDNDESTSKFNEEQEVLASEIKKRKDEILEKKKAIEEAIKSEFHTYASSIYKDIEKLVNKDIKEKLTNLQASNTDLAKQVNAYRAREDGEEVKVSIVEPEVVKVEPLKEVEKEKSFDENPDIDLSFITSDFNAIEPVKQEKKAKKLAKEKTVITPLSEYVEEKPAVEAKQEIPSFEDVKEEIPSFEDEKEVVPSFEEEAEEVEVTNWQEEDLSKKEKANLKPEKPKKETKTIYSATSAVNAGDASEDELMKLQAAIEKENKKLNQHKKDFEKEIDSKISLIEKETKPAQEKVRKKRVASRLSKPVAKKPATTKKPAITVSAAKKPTTVKKSKAYDDLADITTEMENLLKKIKKS